MAVTSAKAFEVDYLDDEDTVRVTTSMEEFDQRAVDERVRRRPVDFIDDNVYVSQRTAAMVLDCALNTFRNAVAREGVQRYLIGRNVRYRWGEIREKILKEEKKSGEENES
ncbi:hypothetical protein EBX31_01875 [bacterium]|nr:hypothetical protein [bacterium]